MDRKCMRKLFGLSCFVNLFLCLFIIYHVHTPSHFNSSPREKSVFSRHDNKFNAQTSHRKQTPGKDSDVEKSRVMKNEQRRDTLVKELNFSTSYDPSFGLQFQASRLPPRNVNELFERIVPNMVYYVWCGKSTFSYRHFLSIYSVWFHLEPDVIEIHYEFPPLEDKYNSWLSWLRTNIPAFSLHALPSHVTGIRCGPSFGLEIVEDRGGVFLNNGVILHSSTRIGLNLILETSRSFSFFSDGKLAFAAATSGDKSIRHYLSSFEGQRSVEPNVAQFHELKDALLFNCSQQHLVPSKGNILKFSDSITLLPSTPKERIFCIHLHESVRPINILQAEQASFLGSFERILYSIHADEDEKGEVKKESKPIPNIIHYIWFGQRAMTLSMYLSFLSSVYIVKPQAVLIHTDLKLFGKYWQLVAKHPLVRLVYREMPSHIYQHRIIYTQHRSDIVRADILDKYGGLYLDWDALWLKSPSDLLGTTTHDIILSRDHIPRPPFPETINMGVVLAKPRSKFIRTWRAAWVNYRSRDFLYNAVELPYKIFEMLPQSTRLHDNLQVMCYFLKCHPLFHPDHKHWGQDQPFDWRKDVYAIHFTHPDPPVFQNETALQRGQGIFADIGRYIWNKSPSAAL